jgi:glyoxylase-like metal-dependent hydrolase (beta-lactamase superfamily II)
MQRITDGVWMLNLGIANAGLLELPQSSGGGLALIDSGGPGSKAKLEQQLATKGWKLSDIKHVLVTHAHYDHVGDLELIVNASNAVVWAHAKEARVIRGLEAPVMQPAHKLSLLWKMVVSQIKPPQKGVVHRELQGDTNLETVMPGLRAVTLPGHAPGQLGYFLEPQKILFGGDVAMNILGLRPPVLAFSADLNEMRRSIRKAANLEPNTLIIGHGQPIIGVAAGALETLAQKLERSKR